MLLFLAGLCAVALSIYISQTEDGANDLTKRSILPPAPVGEENLEDVEVLYFGKGGGFTGASTDYSLSADGTLSREMKLTNTSKQLDTLDLKLAKSFIEKFDSIALEYGSFNKPGNMTYYIKKTKNDSDQTMVWGAHDFTPDSSVIKLYKELVAIVADKK